MAENNITPEERLLKIIEGPMPAVEKRRVMPQLKKTFNINELKARLKGLRFDKNTLKNIDFGIINKVVVTLCAIFTLFWLFDFIRDVFVLRTRFDSIKAEAAVSKREEKALPSIETNISDLLASAKKRNIFTLLPPKPQPQAGPQVQEVAAAVSTIKLVGIIWSDNPQVMIEDSKEQKTYLLSAGEELGDFKVKQILPNKVIISKGEQQWELR